MKKEPKLYIFATEMDDVEIMTAHSREEAIEQIRSYGVRGKLIYLACRPVPKT